MSRKLVYGQAALLGISAATFFLLGLMVGNLTSSPKDTLGQAAVFSPGFAADCRISGVVAAKQDGRDLPDTGAVVILLPKRSAPDKLQAPGLIMPETFVALDNPAIEAIHNAGGAVVRADSEGKFNLLVDQELEFRLLVISKTRRSKGRQLSDQERDMLEAWFAPSEKLLRDNDFLWEEFKSAGDEVEVGMLVFE